MQFATKSARPFKIGRLGELYVILGLCTESTRTFKSIVTESVQGQKISTCVTKSAVRSEVMKLSGTNLLIVSKITESASLMHIV